MKRSPFPLVLILIVMFASSAMAAPPELQYRSAADVTVVRLPSDRERFTQLVDDARAYAEARHAKKNGGNKPGRIETTAVADVRVVGLMVFPAAGSVPGANGTFFRSDVTLINYDTTPQDIEFYWLANNANPTGTDLPGIRLRLDPATVYTFEDFVGRQFGITGLGAMYAIPVDAAGKTDPEASIDGFSRIWTNQPNASGTVSQPFPATDPFSFYHLDAAAVLGLRHDAAYRTNWGLLNLDRDPHRFVVEFIGSTGLRNQVELTLPSQAMTQTGVPPGDYGHLMIRVTVDDPESFWMTYASSTDNITGDGWVSIGSGILTPQQLEIIEKRPRP